MVKVSIIVPVYNVEEYIEEAINSLIKQSIGIENLEVIFIDDGSSDNSINIINKYSKDFNFKLITNENGPSGAAGKPRNMGINIATGKYLIFMDPDDVMVEDGIEILFKTIERYDCDIVTGKFLAFSSLGYFDSFSNLEEYLCKPKYNFKAEDFQVIFKMPNNLCAKIYKTEFIRKNAIEFPINMIAQDTFFVAKTYLLADKITFIPEVIFNYRIRENPLNPSVSQIINVKYFEDFSNIRRGLINLYKEVNKLDYFKVRYFSELRFLLFQLQRAYNITKDQKIKCLKTIEWFLEYSNLIDDEQLDNERKLLLKLIKEKEYAKATELMYINPFVFNKNKAKEIYNKK